jgi:Rieske Fe-S protein
MASADGRLERREVLRTGALVFATIAVGGCKSLFTKTRDADVTVTAANGEARVPVASAPWAKSGGAGTLAVAIAGRDEKVLVFRDPQGALAAVGMTCKHWGCDVNYDGERGHIVCPCHGSEYGNDGSVMKGPTKKPLTAFPVSVAGDEIVLRVG